MHKAKDKCGMRTKGPHGSGNTNIIKERSNRKVSINPRTEVSPLDPSLVKPNLFN